jgi:hypothetical protein
MDLTKHEHHHWTRRTDPDTGVTNHWCITGDSAHHDEPCADAAGRTGEHATDPPGTVDDWPFIAAL